ncbi:MAG: prephenate dehydrogenase/arogenate dehydrogenase family protein [Chloroflexi bacterium]|nr:prephenate dehydrogenase/arogenate dehydrogenase family protein [Chloroflexota bacterium]
MSKIAIIGLGLIGGSIGLALKQSKTPGLTVVGHDAEPSVNAKAVKRGAVDKAPWRLADVVEGADMVVIATPVLAIRETLEFIGPMVSPDCVVTDTGSTKEAVMSWAGQYLPQEVSFVGGHPMAGKELSGIEHADANLFRNARWVVIPAKNAKDRAVKTVVDMAQLLGARPYFLDAFEHDSYVAAVSHLPILLSAALVSATTKSSSWRELSKLASTGYRDVSRLASGDPVMNLDICLTNRDGIVHWLDAAIKQLYGYRSMVNAAGQDESATEKLAEAFAHSWQEREKWVARFESGTDMEAEVQGEPLPSSGQQMLDMIVGSHLRQRYQHLTKLWEHQDQDPRRRRLRKS